MDLSKFATVTTSQFNTWNVSSTKETDFKNGLDNLSLITSSRPYADNGITDPNGISQIVAVAFNGLIIAVGAVGNTHALTIYARKYKIQTKVHPFVVFVLSLAIIDLFTSVFVTGLDIVNQSRQFTTLPEILCKVFRALQIYVHSISVLHVVLISVYCWCKFCFEKQIDGRLAKKLCLGCYALAMLPTILAAVVSGHGNRVFNGVKGQACLVKHTYEGTIWIKLSMGLLVSLFAICFVIICVSYIALVRYLLIKRHTNITATGRGGKTTATLIILTLVFVFSYIPFMALSLIVAFDKDYKTQDTGNAVAANILARFPNLNNVLNPFVYVCKEAEFRKALKQMYAPVLERLLQKNKPESTERDVDQNSTVI